jgi:hypothetical protein
VLPAERGEVGEQRAQLLLAAAAQGVEYVVKIDAVPQRETATVTRAKPLARCPCTWAPRSRSRPRR